MNDLVWGLDVHTEELRSLVLLNGYPAFMPADEEPCIASLKLNPWIVEGTNELRIRLGPARDGERLPVTASFKADVFRTPHGVERDDDSYLVRFEWNPDEHKLDKDGMTIVLSHLFEVPSHQAFGRWAWQDAIPFDPGQRVAIELLVGKCRQALVDRDPDALVALLSLQLAELGQALDVPPDLLEQKLREHLEPFFAADGWEVAPIDYGVVSLVPAADGRIVLVVGRQGMPVLHGIIATDDEQEEEPPPFLMELAVSNLDHCWTVVR